MLVWKELVASTKTEGWTDEVARFSYSEDPKQIKFCHCKDCQRLHGK